ncbi:MAG: 4-hydroxy-tetrahydrodipicolinate reductase [Rhodospirillales bacterium]|nr:MAG: 4-hydroxy-tetrahydrodipicolinate reductase [Rhodospirillales bacterium]
MKIGVTGVAGRMGRMLVQTVLASDGVVLAGGTEHPGHLLLGSDIAALVGASPVGQPIVDDPEPVFVDADVVIDFTVPEAAAKHARLAVLHETALVVGTTGLGAEEMAALREAAAAVPVVQAANMSVGVNLLLGLTRQVAAILGDDYDVEIVEMHHRYKVDAPSGTALALGHAAAAGRGTSLDSASEGLLGERIGSRRRGTIGFATLRGGDVVGEHTVIFAGEGERLELTHRATSRTVFATGAVRAAQWTLGRPPGLYGMREVLGLD